MMWKDVNPGVVVMVCFDYYRLHNDSQIEEDAKKIVVKMDDGSAITIADGTRRIVSPTKGVTVLPSYGWEK